MRVLVTGGSGFVGGHLDDALRSAGHEPVLLGGPNDAPPLRRADVCDVRSMEAIVESTAPDAIVHLAGQPFVPAAIEHPLTTLAVNGTGTANVLEAARQFRDRSGTRVRVVIVSSAEVYGAQYAERMPLDERSVVTPINPYAASKLAAETYANAWWRTYGLDVIVARPFNHIGPGQDRRFVVPTFALQLAEIAAGAPAWLAVGNLAAKRDFLDVRDVAAAYVALLANGRAGEVYNICSGRPVSIQEVLRQLITIARVPVEVREDPERMRASDTPVIYGDATKLRSETGWEPQYALAASLREVYADARERVAAVRA